MPKMKSEADLYFYSTLHRFKVDQAIARVKRKAQLSTKTLLGLLLLLSFLAAVVLTAAA